MADRIMLKAMPFDSNEILDPATGETTFDRAAYSRDLADWLRTYFGNGILVRGGSVLGTQMQVIHKEALTVTVKAGEVCINGRTGWLEVDADITVGMGGAQPRIDMVVAELNLPNDRGIYLNVLTGTPAADPVAPELTQTEDVYQIPLAQVRINEATATVAEIIDERPNHISNVTIGIKPPTGMDAETVALSGETAALYNLTQGEDAYVDNALYAIYEYTNPDLLSWSRVQEIVRAGLAKRYFKVGDQLASLYDGKEVVWDIIGIDFDAPADSSYTHSMTLLPRDCLAGIQFDAAEPTNTDTNRKNNGNNRYIHSAVKQWLNSNQAVFTWSAKHSYDAAPTDSLALYNGPGFLHRLDPELVAVLGAVTKKVARNTVTDGGGQDTFTDKVFLLSSVEVGGDSEGVTTGEETYPFFLNAQESERIKTLDGAASIWWLRSPNVSTSSSVRYVHTSGAVYNYNARYTCGLVPACCII